MGRDYTEDYAYWRESWDEHDNGSPLAVKPAGSYIRQPAIDQGELDEHSPYL
jgi:hypothetical protein